MANRTPLFETHQQLGARIVEFGGWEMPVQYSSIREEHHAVRKRLGLFDVSHMGEIIIEGPDALAAAQRLTCNDLKRLKVNQCQYSALLTSDGTFVDDVIVYPLTPEKILICVNAGNIDKDYEWIQSHSDGAVSVRNESDTWCQLALQGPLASTAMQTAFDEAPTQLERFRFTTYRYQGQDLLISRTGYTGEDGFEIYGPAQLATDLWHQLIQTGSPHGLLPCGLGARDTLRLEVNYPLYGHEIDDRTNPFEAGLAWIVKLDGDDFIGKATLQRVKAAGIQRHLVAFRMTDRSIPRQGYPICLDDQAVGHVVSGTLSPSLDIGIGTGYLPGTATEIGTKIAIDIRGKKRIAAVVKQPFYLTPAA